MASIVLLVALTAAAQKKPRAAESLIADWNSHDVEKVIPVFTDDLLYEDVPDYSLRGLSPKHVRLDMVPNASNISWRAAREPTVSS